MWRRWGGWRGAVREEKSKVSCHVSHRAMKRSLRRHSLGFDEFFPPLIASPVSCPVLLRLDIQYICVCTWPPHEVSCCQYFESRSWALRSVLIQAPGQNASPCSAPYSAAVPTLPLASFSRLLLKVIWLLKTQFFCRKISFASVYYNDNVWSHVVSQF